MQTARTITVVFVISALALGGCSSDGSIEAFCETHTDPELEGLDPSNPEEADKLSDAMAKMEEDAPEEIKEDVATTRAGFEAAKSGDISDIDVDEFQAAAQRVEDYAEEHCTG